ncbi:hypothetical protein GGE65_008382 [Skermanella aerolata]|uniref:hypothetical protein n=1 Tax=Skermanella aerolata TaxID=393310 RepID=UPI003D19C080
MPALTPDDLDYWLKVTQIIVSIVVGIVTVLTYRAAKRGLLNTVNTEYQKLVMARLKELSEDLYSEFDPASPTRWYANNPVYEAVKHINEAFENNKEEVLALRKYYYGVPVTNDVQRLQKLLGSVVSDPFIPEKIRVVVVDLLENRLAVLSSIYVKEFEKYSDNLAKGKRSPAVEIDDINKINNDIVKQRNLQGCGVTQIESAVHDIRLLIQEYFEEFDPHRSRWRRGTKAVKKT